jgi:hypothetical protein
MDKTRHVFSRQSFPAQPMWVRTRAYHLGDHLKGTILYEEKVFITLDPRFHKKYKSMSFHLVFHRR